MIRRLLEAGRETARRQGAVKELGDERRDDVRVTINGLYKVVHWLSIAAEMYDIE